jgi:hypothetical protein
MKDGAIGGTPILRGEDDDILHFCGKPKQRRPLRRKNNIQIDLKRIGRGMYPSENRESCEYVVHFSTQEEKCLAS